MSGTIFSGTYSTGITLSSPSTQDPATIATTGRIDLTGTQGNGIYGTTAAAWVVGNYGTIIAPTRGVFLTSGGVVTNFSTGVISGGYRGVEIDGGVGALINTGSILGTKQQGVKLGGGGDVTNMSGGMITGASTYAAVYILNGGIVSNASGGSINGAVQFDEGAGTLLNAGAINTARSASTGVALLSGGLVSNVAGGTIAGSVAGVYELAGGTVINAGSIGSRYAVTSHTGGIVTNLAGGILTGTLSAVVFQEAAGTVTNAGAITLSGTGVVLGAGGILTNEHGAVINATSVGVRVVGGNVLNAGVIYGGIRYAA
jgi:fibronectin-binding autotransporter adhesin